MGKGSFSEAWNNTIVPITKPGKKASNIEQLPTHIPNKYYVQNNEKTHKPSTPWILETNNVISPYQNGLRQMHSRIPTNKYRSQHAMDS